MPLNFSFSTSATFVSTSTVDGQSTGYAYQQQSYSTPQGSGMRTTEQHLGGPPVTRTRLYDANGRELIGQTSRSHGGNSQGGNHSYSGNTANRPVRTIISIEDVTEQEAEGHARAARAAKAARRDDK